MTPSHPKLWADQKVIGSLTAVAGGALGLSADEVGTAITLGTGLIQAGAAIISAVGGLVALFGAWRDRRRSD